MLYRFHIILFKRLIDMPGTDKREEENELPAAPFAAAVMLSSAAFCCFCCFCCRRCCVVMILYSVGTFMFYLLHLSSMMAVHLGAFSHRFCTSSTDLDE